MPRTARRQERISLRVSARSKSKLERAAAYSDKTLTDFVVDSALRRAETVVRDHDVIALTAEEWERFQKRLLDPPPANRKLRKALAEHSRIVRR